MNAIDGADMSFWGGFSLGWIAATILAFLFFKVVGRQVPKR